MPNSGVPTFDRRQSFAEAKNSLPAAKFNETLAVAAAAVIQVSVIENSAVRNMFQTDTTDQPTKQYTLTKRQSPAFRFEKFGQPPTMIVRQDRVQVTPFMLGHRHTINQIDIDDADFDIISDSLQKAGQEIALMEDKILISAFKELSPRAGGWPTSTETITISDGPGGQGKVLSANAFRIGSTATAPTGGVSGDPSWQDVAKAQTLLGMIGYPTNVILTDPWGKGKLMFAAQFTDAATRGAPSTVETGAFTSVLGIPLQISPLVNMGDIYLMNTDELARWVERQGIRVNTNTTLLNNEWFMYERVCPFIRNANAYIRIGYNTLT